MNILQEGQIKIYKTFKELKKNWDGYDAKPIKKYVLDKILDMSYVSDILTLYKHLGFIEADVNITPIANGNAQFEAEKIINDKHIYLEIEIIK